jgi:oligopeptide/dipeptide ABC transporter ATP-binding protein
VPATARSWRWTGFRFSIAPGEVLGVVGESGAGKSLTGAAIIGLLEPPGTIAAGEIRLEASASTSCRTRPCGASAGGASARSFQDPLTSLNPLYTVGEQLVETIRTHLELDAAGARARALSLLREVGIPAPEARIDHYPHQFSGGMRQRVVIALALCAEPRLIIADEPTTALDVSIQAQIIQLLKRLAREHGTAVMLITHDMGVIAETADRVAVMYAGRIAEIGPVREVVRARAIPIPSGLMGSIPKIGAGAGKHRSRLVQIEAPMPRLNAIPPGCAFNPRCDKSFERCTRRAPRADRVGANLTACWLYDVARCCKLDGVGRDFDVSRPWLNRVIEGAPRQLLHAVDGVSFEVRKGETLALVGESGCGKSTLARLIVGLYAPSRGRIEFDGVEISDPAAHVATARQRRRMQMIFQDPIASLNPRWRVRDIVAEPILVLKLLENEIKSAGAWQNCLTQVGLAPEDGRSTRTNSRAGSASVFSIARALSGSPEFWYATSPPRRWTCRCRRRSST